MNNCSPDLKAEALVYKLQKRIKSLEKKIKMLEHRINEKADLCHTHNRFEKLGN